MSTTEERSSDVSATPNVGRGDKKLEVVVIPVSDAERAKEFYGRLGWRLDAGRASGDDFRIVQFTPPGSDCSIQFGTNLTPAAPGSAQSLYLIVSDIQAAGGGRGGPRGAGSAGVHPRAPGAPSWNTSLTSTRRATSSSRAAWMSETIRYRL
jgi:catechol 2,3-dioxygenase-like lactoylglutathione lyase family enzyme